MLQMLGPAEYAVMFGIEINAAKAELTLTAATAPTRR